MRKWSAELLANEKAVKPIISVFEIDRNGRERWIKRKRVRVGMKKGSGGETA